MLSVLLFTPFLPPLLSPILTRCFSLFLFLSPTVSLSWSASLSVSLSGKSLRFCLGEGSDILGLWCGSAPLRAEVGGGGFLEARGWQDSLGNTGGSSEGSWAPSQGLLSCCPKRQSLVHTWPIPVEGCVCSSRVINPHAVIWSCRVRPSGQCHETVIKSISPTAPGGKAEAMGAACQCLSAQ